MREKKLLFFHADWDINRAILKGEISMGGSPLRKFVSPEIIFGLGAASQLSNYIMKLGGEHPLLVSDPGIIASGLLKNVEDQLKAESIDYTLFSEVTANPKDHEVMDGAEVYRRSGSDMIIAVGGGSPIDCAKGIGIVATNQRHILEFEGIDEVDIPPPPMICIPTTSGTSADISQFAIILDTARKLKISIISKTAVPDVALVDPAMTVTMDRELTAATGMDALTHAIEAYASNAASIITDLAALEAIRKIRRHLVSAVEKADFIEARTEMSTASMLAGLAFSNASLGMVHAMAHSLGGLCDAPHGLCNAILLEHVIRFNYQSSEDKYKKAAEALGLSSASCEKMTEAISDLKEKSGIRKTLRDLGISRSDIPELSKKAANDPCMVTNPRLPSLKEIENTYECAF